MQLHGVTMIPSSLVACSVNKMEVRVTELAYDGFSFRVPRQLERLESLTLHFFKFERSSYQTIELSNYTTQLENQDFYCIYTIRTNEELYKQYVSAIMKDYSQYISLKLAEDDAHLSEQMVHYPAEEDDNYNETFAEQKEAWFTQFEDVSFHVEEDYELAISLDNQKRYHQFLTMDVGRLKEVYLKEHHLSRHPLFQKEIARLYIGNQFCHNLLPSEEEYILLMEKARKENLKITLEFTYLRDELVEQTEELLGTLYNWCCTNGEIIEIVINDWGMLKLTQDKTDYFKLNLGILLNKRRKDPRYPYKQGFQKNVDILAENNLNSAIYRKYLSENWNVSRFEYETCGYRFEIPTKHNSLHLPYYQTNTSQYCTLYAKCMYGDRGNQHLVKNCPHYCDEIVFLYPKHLKMIGKYNSLFGFDDKILKDPADITYYLENGIDRIVLRLL